ncbi:MULTISPECIES: AraC family transcriptional regulator [unclassified Mycobacterium]|uniref:helix-turn-helix transcriptional regulator n=1 Tax=unclassified Mycobacterium TaxID=2642494 RepID=UPI0007400E6E|nr:MULTISPECIES: AraC family transcriptional regulator [unclassified Mycobacterium]KUH81101.1 AraC family transcriptional regulator [Mycobacterium sp. GA-1999]KUH84112.1 AraC family transcriptional regulator [Mycobacterium sp. IS-1556]KUH89977.1 AraC family transcriptional regulator [Mycobacterium sp. GA-0227b]
MALASRLVRHRSGVPMYQYPTGPDTPPVSVVRAGRDEVLERGRHIHDFPALWYVSSAGLVYVAAAGAVLDPSRVDRSGGDVGIFFDPVALGEDGESPWPAWRAHPLLFPFLHSESGGLLELRLPTARRGAWDAAIGSIEAELTERKDGYRQAALAHLTLLLIDLARLAVDVVGDLRHSGEPVLAEVFAVIDRRHNTQLSLRDVAAEIGMTPGHLTTLVRRRTGRTVQEWIIERRMAESRRLLADTDLSIQEVARRVGIADPGYFSRQFRRVHGTSPRIWRGRPG